eukprot:2458827-Pyramimonas_sp.AAC.1
MPRSKAWAKGLRRRCAIRAGSVEVLRKKCCQDLFGREIRERSIGPPHTRTIPHMGGATMMIACCISKHQEAL